MRRVGTLLGILPALCLAGFFTIDFVRAGAPAKTPTFTTDVAPILHKNCAGCHRPAGMAPMSLLSYNDTRPWAKSIRENVQQRKMPPWHADPKYGEFRNERRLTQQEIDTIVAWVDGGSIKGSDSDTPTAPPATYEGWRMGQPDTVLTMPQEYTLAAEGPDEYQYFVIPTNFKEDHWIEAAEARPGNSKVVHHIIAFIQPPRNEGSAAKGDVRRNVFSDLSKIIFYKDGTLMRVQDSVPVWDNGCATPEGGQGIFRDGTGREPMPALLCGEAPGRDPDFWGRGLAKKIPAGANLLLQVHYNKNGSVEKDRSSIGLIFAKNPPTKEVRTMPIHNHYFRIPPGAENHEATACYTFKEDVHFISLMPHMHVRGKEMQIKAVFPDGKSSILLSVPSYSFDWQTTYYLKQPLAIPRGTRIEVIGRFDNSSKNPKNPDSTKAVRWGDPTYDEMLIGWVDYVRDNQTIPAGSTTAPAGK